MIRVMLGLVVLAGTALFVNELCGWLGLIPRGILRLVAMRLPADLRQAVYKEEWLPELLRELREAEGRPITRLVVGIKYAADMALGAGSVGRDLEGIREPERDTTPREDAASSGHVTMSGGFRMAGVTFTGTGTIGTHEGAVVQPDQGWTPGGLTPGT